MTGTPETGVKTFDLLVEGDGDPPLEVECKSITKDKGRKIRDREVLDFVGGLKQHLKSTGLTSGLSVVLTVPEGLPTEPNKRIALARSCARAVLAGRDCTLSDGCHVRISDFDATRLGNTPQEVRREVDRVTNTNNRHAVVNKNRRGGALALTIQSLRDDNLLKSVFETLKDAATKQLTGTRGGLLIAGFDGINDDELASIAQQDHNTPQLPTALRIGVSQLLSSESRSHVIGVGFLSRDSFEPKIVAGQGTSKDAITYWFPKRDSPLWSPAFNGMFKWL